jgi:hypothetical protein
MGVIPKSPQSADSTLRAFSMNYKELPPRPAYFVVNMCSRWNRKWMNVSEKPRKFFKDLPSAYAFAVKQAELHNQGDYCVFEAVGRVRSISWKEKQKKLIASTQPETACPDDA